MDWECFSFFLSFIQFSFLSRPKGDTRSPLLGVTGRDKTSRGCTAACPCRTGRSFAEEAKQYFPIAKRGERWYWLYETDMMLLG